MTRALTWVSLVWDQAMLRYIHAWHLRLAKRRTSHILIAIGVALVAIGGFATHDALALDASVGTVSGLGITMAACAAMGPACIAMVISIMIITAFLYLVVLLLFGISELLTWVVIQAAAYNNFVNATAVRLGWVLVRDVVNMFFIVVLLIIAFSTIIGYKDFHYKQHLPKLLLMAVLINFSRTLVGIMIDFSQVITLTFVNGFKQAAFGNFAKAFGVTNLLKSAEGVSSLGDVGTILISIIFAVTIMTIACTTLFILMMYFIVRIVMLWVLLILSPIAFFASALPGKMRNVLSAVSGSWWSKLSAWLTGGPIVAFFLWLALAVVQQGPNEFSNIAAPTNATEQSILMPTTTEIGKPENIGLLIISVALMLIGVKTAVDVSQQANPVLGQAAARVRSSGGPATWIARRAGRVAGRGAAAAGGALAGKLGGASLALAQKTAKIRVIGSTLARANLAAAQKFGGIQAGVRTAANERIEGQFKGFSTSDQLKGIDTMLGSRGLLNADDKAALERKRALLVTKGEGQKAIGKDEETAVRSEFATMNKGRKLTPAEEAQQEDQIKAKAADRAKARIQGYLTDAKKAAESNGDTETADKIDEAYKKNPSLYQYGKDVQKAVNGVEDKEIATDAMRDGAVVAAILVKHGLVDESGKLKQSEGETLKAEPIKKIIEAGGDRARYFKAGVHDFAGEGSGRLERLTQGLASDKEVDLGEDRLHMSKDKNGQNMLFAHRNKTPEARAAMSMADISAGRQRINSEAELMTGITDPGQRAAATGAMRRLGATPQQFDRPLDNRQVESMVNAANVYSAPPPAPTDTTGLQRMAEVQGQALANGIPTAVATNYDTATGSYRNDASRTTHLGNMEGALQSINDPDPEIKATSRNMIANTDAEAVKGGGAMRDVVAEAMNKNADSVKELFKKASGEQGKKLQALMTELASQAETVLNRGGTMTAGERHLVDLHDKLGGSKAMRNMGGGKKKDKTA